jgi:flagellar motor switch/type III secretory pathway protein FliN
MVPVTARPYPWTALERVPRKALRRLGELREHAANLRLDEVAAALETLVGARVRMTLATLHIGAPPQMLTEVTLGVGDGSVTLGAEPGLVTTLLERIFARPLGLARPNAELEPSVLGAFAALAVEVARRVSSEPITLGAPLGARDGVLCALVHVFIDERAFTAYALAALRPAPTAGVTRPDPAALGDLPLAVPLVVAISLARPDELRRLAPGAAFMPGERAWVNVAGAGRGVLVAATAERGVAVELPPDGRLVLRGDEVELSSDAADSTEDDAMSDADDLNQTLVDAALEAPVVVRVELGAVSMTAAAWAKLRPGDVIETGRRVAEPVILRVAGRVVARGELVDVEGEVGVRVRELLGTQPER